MLSCRRKGTKAMKVQTLATAEMYGMRNCTRNILFLIWSFFGVTDAFTLLSRGRSIPSIASLAANPVGHDNTDAERIRAIGGPRADVYGEMTRDGLRTTGQAIGLSPTDRFLDLGSGDGGLVLQAPIDFGVVRSMGIELSQERHARAVAAAESSDVKNAVTFVMGDAAGDEAVDLLRSASVVWCSNLLFGAPLQERLAHHIATHGQDVRVVVSLKEFPSGIAGFQLQKNRLAVEMSWTAGKHQKGHPPLPGHPCCLYAR